MLNAPAILEISRARSFRYWMWVAVGIGIVSTLIWKVSPLVTATAHQAEGYEYLNQALEILGDQTGPDYCVNGGVFDPQAMGLVERAIEALQKAQKARPTNSQSLLLLGRAYCLSGNFEAAVKAYEGYTVLRPENPLGYLELGFAYEGIGSSDTANLAWGVAGMTGQELLDKGKEEVSGEGYGNALSWYSRATIFSPGLEQAWLQTGLVYEKLGKIEEARGVFEKAWELNADIATADYAKAMNADELYENAEDVLRQSLASYPLSKNRNQWWKLLGENLETRGKWEDAIVAYQNALDEYPNDVNFLIRLGWSFYRSSQNDEGYNLAQQMFEKAIAINNLSGEGYYSMGELLRQEGKYSDADFWFQEAITRNPMARWWYITRGRSSESAGNFSFAIEIYNTAIELFPDFAQSYYEISWLYNEEERADDAIVSIEQAISLTSQPRIEFYVRAGQIYEGIHMYEQAYEAYQQALQINQSNTYALEGIQRINTNYP